MDLLPEIDVVEPVEQKKEENKWTSNNVGKYKNYPAYAAIIVLITSFIVGWYSLWYIRSNFFRFKRRYRFLLGDRVYGTFGIIILIISIGCAFGIVESITQLATIF